MSTALSVVRETRTDHLSNVQRLGTMLAASGYFSDVKDTAQAAVKVMAGEELGIAPVAAVMGIHIIKGKVTLSGNLIASLVRRHGYDYRHKQFDNNGCVLEFYGKDKSVLGESSFTEADAKLAGVFSDMYKKFPRNMYFNRAMSNGAKWYCPEVTSGLPVYVPEELGARIDSEGNVEEPTKEEMAQAAQDVAKRKIAAKKAKVEDLDVSPADTGAVDTAPLAICGPSIDEERAELTNSIRQLLNSMAPAYDAADPASMAAYKKEVGAVQFEAFGVPSWKKITELPLEGMRAGLSFLQAKANTTPEDSLEAIWTDKISMRKAFGVEKDRLIELVGEEQGQREYYTILEKHGAEKSTSFDKDLKAAMRCYVELRAHKPARIEPPIE